MRFYPRYNRGRLLACLFLAAQFTGGQHPVYGQVNLFGKPGLINTPSAVEMKDGEFVIGYSYNPRNYSFRTNGRFAEQVLFTSIGLLPRLELNFFLMKALGKNIPFGERGIGDRQLDVKYAVYREKQYFPALAVIITAPFGIDYANPTYTLVATKHFMAGSHLQFQISAGYEAPFFVKRNIGNLQNRDFLEGFTLQNKKDVKTYRTLWGAYGGLRATYRKRLGIMVEWDTLKVNAGAYFIPLSGWTIRAGLLNGDQWTLGTSYALSLFGKSKTAPDESTKP